MIDNFALALTHVLMLVAAWRLTTRADLDEEDVRDPGLIKRKPAAIAKPDTDA